ncbi:hypothetical protein FHG87_006610 [Trinorchestia longiramus]|nr:hypothetical protein FHG87_006610 [Trinorchestia longiramus]
MVCKSPMTKFMLPLLWMLTFRRRLQLMMNIKEEAKNGREIDRNESRNLLRCELSTSLHFKRPDTEHGPHTTRLRWLPKDVLKYKLRIKQIKNKRWVYLMDVVHEQYGENKGNARCVEGDSGMRYLVRLHEECNMTVVVEMKYFLVHA